NLMGAEMPDVKTLVPEWSTRSPGQDLIMAPLKKYGSIATMELVEAIPNERLTYRNKEGVWSFLLLPLGENECRLICRGTWVPSPNPLARFMRALIFDPGHFLMEWKMIRTIKHLAEESFV